MIPVLIDKVLKKYYRLNREQRTQRLFTIINGFYFNRKYIIVIKLSVKEIKREITVGIPAYTTAVSKPEEA